MSDLPIAIESKIYKVRSQRIMLDSDLASLYSVETKRLNEQVKRNSDRFPQDFMFQLTTDEWDSLRSQIATSKTSREMKSQSATSNRGGRRTNPYVFTEHGTVMLASVLNSPVAIQASIQIVKAFVKFREILSSQAVLEKRIIELESKYDDQFKQVFDAIRGLTTHHPSITTTKKGRKD